VKKSYWYIRTKANKNTRLLPAFFRWKVGNMKIHVTEFSGLTDDETREMFKRIQAGKTLNLAEKLHAIDSTWANYVKQLDKKIDKGFWGEIFFRNHRMASFLSLVRLVWYLTRLGYPSFKLRCLVCKQGNSFVLVGLPDVPSPDDLTSWITHEPEPQYENQTDTDTDTDTEDGPVPIDAPTERFKAWVTIILKKFQTIGTNEDYHKIAFCPIHELPIGRNVQWRLKNYPKGTRTMTMSPVEVLCACLYISRNTDLDPAILARGIQNIRNLIYERFVKERKLNKFTMQHFWLWLLNHDGDGGAADDYRTPPPDASPAPEEARPARRRKRTTEAAGSQPGPSKRTKKATPRMAAVMSDAGEQIVD